MPQLQWEFLLLNQDEGEVSVPAEGQWSRLFTQLMQVISPRQSSILGTLNV